MSKRDLENEFEAKYNEYGNMLYKIAFLYLGNASDTEDVLQDVFTKYLCGKYKFKNTEHEKSWFIRVTQNKCLTLRKAVFIGVIQKKWKRLLKKTKKHGYNTVTVREYYI